MSACANVRTIAKRELVAYFSSPVAYVFIVIFLFLTGVFTFMLGGFFERGDASLVSFLMFLPWLYLFLVPAVGMGLWSEERRSGTMELLLTFPITSWQAIVGKFIASWVFLGIALLLTCPIAGTVYYLGHPDSGVIFTSYFGSFLLAGAFLAVTCMTSAMSRNQVISFIVSVVICLFLLLLGIPQATNFLMQVMGLSQSLVETIASFGVMTHFEWLQRGVVDSRDLIYYISMILFFLFTTGVIIRSHRAG